jgi:class 3 adenylate cyclase/DNA-binding response OmpR family regulator
LLLSFPWCGSYQIVPLVALIAAARYNTRTFAAESYDGMSETPHVLIVDDDPAIRRVFQQLLTANGYRVSLAASGEEALAYLELITPDLIMMDLNMRGITGIEATARIKSDATKPFIPIILITARGDQTSKVDGLDSGADDFMVKPVDLTELQARIRSLLRLQRSRRSLRAEQRKTELLLQLTSSLNTTLDFDQLLAQFLNRLADSVGAVRSSIILITEEQPRLYSSTGHRESIALEEILRDGAAGWVLRQRSALIVDDTRLDSRWIARTSPQQVVRSVAAAPIIRDNRDLGVITLVHHTPGYFTAEHIDLLVSVGTQCAFALDNARLYRQVEDERSLLNAVLRGAADSILLIDPYDELVLANRAAGERFDLIQAIGTPIHDLKLHPDLLQALSKSAAATGVPHEVVLPDQSTFSVSVAAVQAAGEQELIGRVVVIQDISASRELERREQERLRDVFRRYVSPQVAEEVLAGGVDFGSPAERDVVVLFADIRGYTTLTEGLPPRVLVEQVLNRYFNAMTAVIHRYAGTVDKFMGDGMIGLFGVPIARVDDIQRSLAAAIEMQQACDELRAEWLATLNRDIGIGIGLSYGRAVVGNIGSTERLDYTVIGDVVNTASRLNGLAEAGEIVVSHSLVDALAPNASLPGVLRVRGPVTLKGKQEPHLVYDMLYDV